MDYLKEWRLYLLARYSHWTTKAYIYEAQHFREQIDLLKAQPADVVNYITSERLRGLSATTVARSVSALRAFYGWARLMGLVEESPVKSIKGPKGGRKLPKALNEQETKMLLQASHPPRDLVILMLMLYAGLRLVEVAKLKRSSVDLVSRHLQVIGKGDKERIIPLHPDLHEVLEDWLLRRDCNPDEPLFPGYCGGALRRRAIADVISKAGWEAALLRRLSPHILRHTFATRLLRRGVNLRFIQELLGHASVATTQIYTEVVSADLVNAVATL